MQGTPDQDSRARRRARLIVGAIAVTCAGPIVAALIAYFVFPPAGRVNYGELLPPKTLPAARLLRADGRPFALSDLRGKWVLLHADRAECAAACETKLFNMRQARLAQGREMDRIERVWLLLDEAEPAPAITRLYEGAVLARDPDRTFARSVPTADVRDHIYLIDPLGNLMLRFPKDADPKRMIKDLERLLKASRIG
jgi:cytochrome oxidase Cu insertion factor (SCO1/SenC/PrrC family)